METEIPAEMTSTVPSPNGSGPPPSPIEVFMVDVRTALTAIHIEVTDLKHLVENEVLPAALAGKEISTIFEQFGMMMGNAGPDGMAMTPLHRG